MISLNTTGLSARAKATRHSHSPVAQREGVIRGAGWQISLGESRAAFQGRGQRSEVGGRRSEVGGRRSEVRVPLFLNEQIHARNPREILYDKDCPRIDL